MVFPFWDVLLRLLDIKNPGTHWPGVERLTQRRRKYRLIIQDLWTTYLATFSAMLALQFTKSASFAYFMGWKMLSWCSSNVRPLFACPWKMLRFAYHRYNSTSIGCLAGPQRIPFSLLRWWHRCYFWRLLLSETTYTLSDQTSAARQFRFDVHEERYHNTTSPATEPSQAVFTAIQSTHDVFDVCKKVEVNTVSSITQPFEPIRDNSVPSSAVLNM